MSQPPAYNRSFSFTNFQTSNPTTPLPAVNLDIELNNVKATLDALNANIALIQNDENGNPPAWYSPVVLEPGEAIFERVSTEEVLRSIFLNYARHRAKVEGGRMIRSAVL